MKSAMVTVDDEVCLEDDWVPMDEQLGAGELEEVIRAKEHILEQSCLKIGDIPDAEIKPPDSVLFVCKLNPVTEFYLPLVVAVGRITPIIYELWQR